ncbi:AimR family lysis-lysogeny pheromone receptor [Virgibacillus kimchii]
MHLPTTILANKDELTLEELMEILLQEHDNETVTEMVKKYCMQSGSLDIQKKSMEFLYMHGYYKELQQLVNKNKESDHASNQLWAKVYQINIDRRFGSCTPNESLKQIRQVRTSEAELKCIVEFTRVTIYYDLNQFSKIGNFLDIQHELFGAVRDKLLLSYFKIRLNQILMTYYLMRNEIIMARKYGYRVLNHSFSPRTKASTHVRLGLSYTFDTYFQAMHHIQQALQIAKKHNLHNAVRLIEGNTIPFLSAHFNKPDGITAKDQSEQAHLEIARGNNEKAIEILSELSLDSPFVLYYLGKAKRDKDLLLQSYSYFIEKRSDYFFSRLPLNILRNM